MIGGKTYALVFLLFASGGFMLVHNLAATRQAPPQQMQSPAPDVRWPAIDSQPNQRWRTDQIVLPRTAEDEQELQQTGNLELARRPPTAWRDLPERYDLSLRVALPAPQRRLGILFGYQNASNYYYAEISDNGTRIGRLEGGLDVLLGGSDHGLPVGRAAKVSVKRRELETLVLIDGRLVGRAYDNTFSGGLAALALPDADVRTARLLRQIVERHLAFADDFMRPESDPGPWEVLSGNWRTRAPDNPSLSANAFTCLGWGPDARTVTGRPFWDHYVLRASMRGPIHGAMGLLFGQRDRNNYFLFRWYPRPASGEATAERQIVRVRDGVERIVARQSGGYLPGQWYRVEVELQPGHCSVSVDGHDLLQHSGPDLVEGRVGLYADTLPIDEARLNLDDGSDKVTVDDVVVSNIRGFHDSFDDPQALGRWQQRGGTWTTDGALNGRGEGRLLVGSDRWGNYSFAARIDAGSRAGLVFNYRDERNYHVADFDFDQGAARLRVIEDGTPRALDEQRLTAKPPLRTTVRTDHGHLSVAVNGAALLEAWDQRMRRGRVGFAAGAGQTRFDDAQVRFAPPRDPVVAENAIFAEERTMMSWAGEINEWYEGEGSFQGGRIYWHRANFPGDLIMTAQLEHRPQDNAEAVLALSAAKSGLKTDGRGNGYVLVTRIASAGTAASEAVDSPPSSGDVRVSLELMRMGDSVAETTLDLPYYPRSIMLRRAGRFVVGAVDNRPELVFRDVGPLLDTRVAFAVTDNLQLQPRNITVYNGHVFDETFGTAPTEWRVGAGWWEITNRWQCDDRWRFYGGRSFADRDHPRAGDYLKPAVLWNRRLFERDVTVEMFVAPMMIKALGSNYDHARDFNITISGDGEHCSSGYTCSLGAQDNKMAAIYRGNQRVADDPHGKIMRHKRIHRQWYYLRVQRQRDKITFDAWQCPDSNNPWKKVAELTFEDPEPLSGRQIAIWTYGTGMVVGRVRVSGPGGVTFESLDRNVPDTVQTFYDEDGE